MNFSQLISENKIRNNTITGENRYSGDILIVAQNWWKTKKQLVVVSFHGTITLPYRMQPVRRRNDR